MGLLAYEEKALGSVTFEPLERGQALATVMFGGRMDRERSSEERPQLSIERVRKFEISWQAYNIAKARAESEAREDSDEDVRASSGREHGHGGAQSGVEQVEEGEDYDVGWMLGIEG